MDGFGLSRNRGDALMPPLLLDAMSIKQILYLLILMETGIVTIMNTLLLALIQRILIRTRMVYQTELSLVLTADIIPRFLRQTPTKMDCQMAWRYRLAEIQPSRIT